VTACWSGYADAEDAAAGRAAGVQTLLDTANAIFRASATIDSLAQVRVAMQHRKCHYIV
jgi:hypothetical protein